MIKIKYLENLYQIISIYNWKNVFSSNIEETRIFQFSKPVYAYFRSALLCMKKL